MDHRFDFVFGKNALQHRAVTDVALVKWNVFAGNLFQAWQNMDAGIAQIVENHNIVA